MSHRCREQQREYGHCITREVKHLHPSCPSAPQTHPAEMDAVVDAADPRVAPAVQQLSAVAQRVYMVWQRMGVASRDRQQKWSAFLFGSLLPFLEDFCTLQEAAEYNAATENDALLRDVCHLAVRLDESPRQPEVASIVSLLKEHYAQTQQRHPFAGSGVGCKATSDEAGPSANTAESTATPRCGGDVEGDAETGIPPSGAKELMYLTLPSFTVLIDAACLPGQHSGEKGNEQQQQQQQERLHQGGGVGLETDDGNGEQGANVSGSNDRSTATQALRRLLHNNTHEGVRQQLQAELDRLQRLADNRLQVLQLLCKQRAIMNRSTQEQVVLRAAYRAKYLGKEEVHSGSELGKRTSLSLSAAGDRRPLTTIAVDTASMYSSGFVSPLTSPKMSGHTAASVVPSSGKCEEDNSSSGANEETDAIATLVNRPTTSLQDATREELQLLLSAASCSLEVPHSTHGGDGSASHTSLEHSEEGELGNATWPTCSSTTTTTTEARVASQKAWPSAGVLVAAKTADTHTKTAVSSAPSTPSGEAARATVLEVDVSSITAYGTHQNLALSRIHAEAEAVVRSIDEHNRRMQLEAQEELHALETLEVLWRAISVQRTSPNASSLLSLPHRGKDEAGSQGEASGSVHSSGNEKNAVARSAINPISPPLFEPLKPEPYRETTEEIVARYRQLHAAYEADVAAQQQPCPAASVTLLQTMPVPASSAGSPPSSLKSSTSLTSLATVNDSDSAGDQKAVHRMGGGLYLPPLVRQILRAASYAPVLDYVRRSRLAFQAHLSTQQDVLVEKTMARLRNVYEAYYAATHDKTYAVAPDGELRVAMEEELLETFQAQQSAVEATRHQQRCDEVDNENASSTVSREAAAVTSPPPSPSGKVLLSFQRHLMACQQVREQAADEIEFLRLRLHIIEQAAPLVQNYQEIVREEAEMHATSRERLLNKKVNMAKQLLQEEKTRRRVAKELPRILSLLKELVAAWDALQAATDPREDIADVGDCHNDGPGASMLPPPPSAKAELWIRGQRVRDLLTASQTTTVQPVSRVRSRSASSPQPLRSHPPPRSVSPAPPALARHRVEQRFAVPDRGLSLHSSRKGSPTPARTPLPGCRRVAGDSSVGVGVATTSVERPGHSLRPHSNTKSPSMQSCTPSNSKPTARSYRPGSLRPLPPREPSRSPPPLWPVLPHRGLSPVSSNTNPQAQRKTAHTSTSPSPSSASTTTATTTRFGRVPFS
ncbi:Microtubule associated protein [Leishmania braziliensis]|nr:Microtubule associated protein [Leishmania braziliensis]